LALRVLENEGMKSASRKPAQKRILIVDDDDGVSMLVAEALGARGYKISRVQDGIEAINTILARKPDLVVLDLALPRLSGYEICSMVRKAESVCKTPIVILSGQGNVDDRLQAFAVGADDYVIKPFDIDELVARVEAVMMRSHGKALPTPFLAEDRAA
jgi:DNA-binding response OmpR family regulator